MSLCTVLQHYKLHQECTCLVSVENAEYRLFRILYFSAQTQIFLFFLSIYSKLYTYSLFTQQEKAVMVSDKCWFIFHLSISTVNNQYYCWHCMGGHFLNICSVQERRSCAICGKTPRHNTAHILFHFSFYFSVCLFQSVYWVFTKMHNRR